MAQDPNRSKVDWRAPPRAPIAATRHSAPHLPFSRVVYRLFEIAGPARFRGPAARRCLRPRNRSRPVRTATCAGPSAMRPSPRTRWFPLPRTRKRTPLYYGILHASACRSTDCRPRMRLGSGIRLAAWSWACAHASDGLQHPSQAGKPAQPAFAKRPGRPGEAAWEPAATPLHPAERRRQSSEL